MKILLGLGNPGTRYDRTRHNIGFEVLDELARRFQVEFKKAWFTKSLVAKTTVAGEPVVLAKPRTYMNHSGFAAAALLKRSRAKVEDLMVVYDDADLPPGRLRIRGKGGPGHHNGLKSLIGVLDSQDFARLRVGIGEKPKGSDMAAFVLSPFGPEERETMDQAVQRGADALQMVLEQGPMKAMNEFNKTT